MIAREPFDVTYAEPDRSRIPDLLIEGAGVLMDLRRRGKVDEVGRRLKIRRQGGFCALDVWVDLMLYMTTGADVGVRKFWEEARPHSLSLAALAGRRRLPSPASLSRALGAAEVELVREQALWMLLDLPDVEDVLRHPAVQTYDTMGRGWHVFDVDPTVTTLRHRALPVGDDLPEPMRRSEETGAPGHAGRKRGDVQHRRVTAQHAGSGLWVHAHLSAGNGEGVVDFERALDSIVAVRERLDHPRERTLLRMDGEYGNVPWFTACRERGLPFITRLNRPTLYEDPAVLARLREATWFRVPDSGSGPQRAAADVGVLTIRPDRKTKRPDGSAYEPVDLRVVASIFPKEGKAKRGRTLDGWQVELFAVDVDAQAWPAPEAVAAYFGRSGCEENRFAQEDRELGLDRIVSYHLPGQELAALVGLSLWNLRVARGFELEPPPSVQPPQCLRHAEKDERVPAGWPRDPVVVAHLDALDWDELLAKRPGWSYAPGTGELRCPDGRALTLTTARSSAQRPGLVFRRPTGGCSPCETRPDCLRSADESAVKHAEVTVAPDVAAALHERLAIVRRKAPPRRETRIESVPERAGLRRVVDALFLPARARQRFGEVFRQATLHVVVELPADIPGPRLVAVDAADRQRRRRTWKQRVERYALPPGATVRMHVEGGGDFRELMGERRRGKVAVGASA